MKQSKKKPTADELHQMALFGSLHHLSPELLEMMFSYLTVVDFTILLGVNSKFQRLIYENPKCFAVVDLTGYKQKIGLSNFLKFITYADSEIKKVIIESYFNSLDVQK